VGIVAMTDEMDTLIDRDAQVTQIATGSEFTEGPVWHPEQQTLLFTDMPNNAIRSWSEADGAGVWRQPSNMANGLTFDAEFRLIACEAATSHLTRTEANGDRTILASHYQGQEINSPNDVVVRSDGSIYFSDPPSGRSRPHGVPRPRYLDFQGVFRVPPGGGDLDLVVADMTLPNGLCFSPDESVLYIDDSRGMHIKAFDVHPDGSLSGGDIIFTQPPCPDPGANATSLLEEGTLAYGVPDGMKCDQAGNIWCTGQGGIWVISPSGHQIGLVETPEIPANLAWGGPTFQTLYVCATRSVYSIPTRVRGCAPGAHLS
jgi:gluconolactonase